MVSKAMTMRAMRMRRWEVMMTTTTTTTKSTMRA
jgi:hypothetical protein